MTGGSHVKYLDRSEYKAGGGLLKSRDNDEESL
jgi:hypothetical protein